MPLFATFSLIVLPWLNPFSSGPVLAALPLLLSWACMAVLVGGWHWRPEPSCEGRRMREVAGAWVVAGVISSVIGLCQYFGVAGYFSPWMNWTHMGEAFANLRQRNHFASLTNLSLAALVWLVATGRFTLHRKWLALMGAALLAIGNAASSSRTGLLQFFLLCVLCWVWGVWRQPPARRVLLTAVLVYVLALLALPWLAGIEFQGHGALARMRDGDPGCASRLTLWSNVLHLIAQKPWVGWGWGELDYAHYMTLYPGNRFCGILDNAHNLPLHLAVEMGIPVALLVCGMAAWLVLRARPWREADATRQMVWSVLALIMLHSLLEYPLWYGPFQMALGLCVGLLWAAEPSFNTVTQQTENFETNKTSALYFRVGAAITVIALVIYVGVDYHRVSQIYLAPDARHPAYRDDTLNKIRDTRLFGNQLRFAELSVTPLTPVNAAQIHALSGEVLHYSPEPRVIEKKIESAVMLGRDDEAFLHLARYRAAFPQDHAKWRDTNGGHAKPY